MTAQNAEPTPMPAIATLVRTAVLGAPVKEAVAGAVGVVTMPGCGSIVDVEAALSTDDSDTREFGSWTSGGRGTVNVYPGLAACIRDLSTS